MRPSKALAIALALGTALLTPEPGLAADAQPTDQVNSALVNARAFDLSLFAPSAPGFVVLGLSPRRAADPGSFRTFGADAANLSGVDGYEFGAALSFEPFWWSHDDMTLGDYQRDTTALERVFARTQVSVAGSYAHGDQSRFFSVGVGVQAQLLDIQDERYDPNSYNCLLQAWQAIRQVVHQSADDAVLDYLMAHPSATESELKAVRDAALGGNQTPSAKNFAEARNACRDAASLASLAKPSLMAGFGGALRTKNADFNSIFSDGGSAWATYRRPLLYDGLVSAEIFGRYAFGGRLNELAKGPLANMKGNETDAGAGLTYEQLRWRVEISGAFVSQNFESSLLGIQDFSQASLGGAVRLWPGFWLQASGTDSFGGPDDGKPSFSLAAKFDWEQLAGAVSG